MVALAGIAAARAPRRVLLCAYAGAVPFGSGITVPVPLPAPFNTLTTLLGLGALAAFAVGLTQPRGQARQVPPAAAIALLLLAAVAATYAWSIDRDASLDAVLVLGSLVLLYVVISASHVDEDDVEWLRTAIVVGGVLACAYGFVLLLTGQLPEEAAGVARFSTAGGVGDDSDPNITAATLVLPLVLAAAMALERSGLQRTLAGAAAALLAAGILLTASRGGVVGSLVALVVLTVARRTSLGGILRIAGALAAVTLAASVLAPGQFERLGRDTSSGRTSVWELGLAACESRCASGSGVGTYLLVHQDAYFHEPFAEGFRASLKAHNIWLQAGVETGVLGVTLLLALFVAVVTQLLRLPRARRAPPLAAIAGLLVTNAFLGNLAFKYFWLVLVYAAVTAAAAPRRAREEIDPAAAVLRSASSFQRPALGIASMATGVALLAGGSGGAPSHRAVATVVASESPKVTEAGIDEAIEAVFEANEIDADLGGRANAVAYTVTVDRRDAADAAAAANQAAHQLVTAFNASPVAFTRLIVAQEASAELTEVVSGPPSAGRRAATAITVGAAAGMAFAVGAAILASRPGRPRRRSAGPASTPHDGGAMAGLRP